MDSGTLTTIEAIAAEIKIARHVVAFTGAGISTPSGIPDFRSAGSGLWTRVDPMEAASLTAFRRRPDQFYDWLRPLVERISRASPNPAHLALAQLEQAGRLKAVLTQNIDDLHQKAGSQKVIQLHGSLQTSSCMSCLTTYQSDDFKKQFLRENILPRCPRCHSILKPDITLFEEALPAAAWDEAEHLARRADLMLVIGSSLEVMPAAMIPLIALESGAALIIITRSETYLNPRAKYVLQEDVAQILPKIAECALI